ncbi:unnamed protein product (macronuclear) [Paramecium tetraurelia]|uniref:Uncharacterized protein n=1 Tax=Paramecium tetraurelia TaxID=5888 RepID=A0EII4_PARTE|nr:uncharacterized protein GSPATT00027454001 [Paramecium tetraurelia]CAK95125.1 unnamed protein product [Paramecium tetraurelia]|eukprot:XP_001462498.1 hypothetical protein (macronuclear) [Paramecium tetraurelia strain d4-2]
MSDYQIKYQEIKGSLALLLQQNYILKQQLKEATQEVQEKLQLKEEWAQEVQRVQETIHQLAYDNQNYQQENEQLSRENQESQYVIEQQIEQITTLKQQNETLLLQLDESRQQNLQKEITIKQQRDEFNKQLEKHQSQHYEEIKKLQGIIDNQSGLIQSYEKLNEIEKLDTQNSFYQQQMAIEDQMIELKNRNIILTNKINEEKQKYEQLYEQHKDEVTKLQGVVKDQKELLSQYERIIERDKKQMQPKPENNLHYTQSQVIPQQAVTLYQHEQQPQQSFQPQSQQVLSSPLQYEQYIQPALSIQTQPTYSQPAYTQPSQNYTQPMNTNIIYTQPVSHRQPKTFFTNNKINHQLQQQQLKETKNQREHPFQKNSFHLVEGDDGQRSGREFQEQFLYKCQNVIGRMEDKLQQMQSELNISDVSDKPRKLK